MDQHQQHLATGEEGATAVEYGVLVAAVGIALVVAGPYLWQVMVQVLGQVVDGMLG